MPDCRNSEVGDVFVLYTFLDASVMVLNPADVKVTLSLPAV